MPFCIEVGGSIPSLGVGLSQRNQILGHEHTITNFCTEVRFQI